MTLDEAKAMLRFMIYNPVTEEEAEATEVILDTVETLEEDCDWYNDTFVRID